MCWFREITRRLFVTHEIVAFGVRRDVFKALYHTCHNIFSQRRTVSWIKAIRFQADSVSTFRGISIRIQGLSCTDLFTQMSS